MQRSERSRQYWVKTLAGLILDIGECDGGNIDTGNLIRSQYFDIPRCGFDDQSAIWAYPCLFAAVHPNRFAAVAVNCEWVPFLAFQNRPDPIDHHGVSLIQKVVRFKFG
jgi:hypothetical protein